MSFPDPSWQYRDAVDFGGGWNLPDAEDIPIGQGAISARNVEFVNGQVSCRHGFGTGLDLATSALSQNYAISAMHHWLTGAYSFLLFWVPGQGSYCVSIASPASLASGVGIAGAGTSVAGVFVSVGSRFYTCGFDSSQVGTGAGVAIGLSSGTPTSGGDLFRGPMAYTPSAPTEPGSGVVTAGTHNLGYLLESVTGFVTRPSPDSSTGTTTPTTTSFTPVAFTSAGAKNLQWVLNTTWPSDAAYVSIIMTPVDSPSHYYIVPGSRKAVASGAHSYTFTIDISDDDLIATATDATPYLYQYTESVAGNAPFNPSNIVPLGTRMGYITKVPDSFGTPVSTLFVSEPYNHQSITQAQHVINLPGNLDMVTAFSLSTGTHYIVGPHWTYETSDNLQVPVDWPTPKVVDGGRGTLAIRGVDVAHTGAYAWVADVDGLYLFTGQYSELPVSYLQTPDWKRINWSQAAKVIVKDNPAEKKVYVIAPIDGSTSVNAMMTWDYTNGKTPTAVKYSGIDQINYYPLGALAVVQNDLAGQATGNQKQVETWVGGSAAVPILRKLSDNDTHPKRDFAWPHVAQVNSDSASGQKVLHVTTTNLAQLYTGMQFTVGSGTARQETVVAASINAGAGTITCVDNLAFSHTAVQADWVDLDGVPVAAYYDTALFPGKESQNGINHFHGMHCRIRGTGNMAPVIKSLDGTRTLSMVSKALSTAPAQELRWLTDFKCELASLLFQTTNLDDDFILSSIRMYYGPWITTR